MTDNTDIENIESTDVGTHDTPYAGGPPPGYPYGGPPQASPYAPVPHGQQGNTVWQQLTPMRLALAGVVLVVAAFLGGFLVGHATAGDGSDGGFGPGGGRGGFGQGPGNGQMPGQGQGQGQGTGQSGTTTS